MLNYYEETMPLETDEDAYKKYLIDEDLPLFDKLNIIIKKGDSIQKQALLNSLNIYINDCLFKSLIEYIISEIVTWDIEIRLIFPRCLNNILLNYLSSINNEIFNIIFKHIILSISSGNEKISKEYIFYFDILIEEFTRRFNNGETFPYQIKDDIFEIIISLGKFGQNTENIRLCCYLSSCMCRLVGHVDENENVQKMFRRICLLFNDLEKNTERQISRELRYLIPIFKEKILEKNDIIKAIKSYINHDWDHAIQTTTIVSLMANYEFISDEMKELIFDKIKEIFEEINYEKKHKNNIIQSFINILYKLCIEYEIKNKNNIINYELNDLIDNTLNNMKFMSNWVNSETVEPLLIINFDKLSKILNYSFLYNDNKDFQISSYLHNLSYEESTNINAIFFKIFSKIIPKSIIHTAEPDSSESYVYDENLTKLLLLNLYKMIPCINNLKYVRNLYEKIINLFKKDFIIPLLKIYENEFTSNNYSKDHNYLYRLLKCLLEKGYNNQININSNNNKNSFINNSTNGNNSNLILLNENNYYFKLFHNILESLFYLYKTSQTSITYQTHVLIAKTFQKIIKQIYKYYKPYSKFNRDKTNSDTLFDEIFKEYLIHIIKNDEVGNQTKIEYINVIPYLILYGKKRQSYYNFIEDEIMKSSSFYIRRCSINFIEKCLSIYSFKLFLKFYLMEIIYYLINDENNIISASIIEKIIPFFRKMKLYSNNGFDKIISMISEIDNSYKDKNSDKNVDIEKKRVIKKLLNLNNNYNQNNNKEFNREKRKNFYGLLKGDNKEEEKEIKQIKLKESKHIIRETEIFGKSYQNITLHNTINYLNKINYNEKIEKKLENENKNDKSSLIHNEDLNQSKMSQKEKIIKKKILEKSSSGIMLNINTKTTTKKFLPKIKQFVRKNSLEDRRSPFFNISLVNGNNNNNNNNVINIDKSNQLFKKSINLNKIMLLIKDKTPEKKPHLRSINNRLPSASSTKVIDSFSINVNKSSSFRPRHLFFIQNKLDTNICLDDTNYQMINVSNLNKSSLLSHIIGYSGKDFYKQIGKSEIKKNQINKGLKLNQSHKKVILFLKSGIKDIKYKKDELNNKIVINAKVNEINKSNK